MDLIVWSTRALPRLPIRQEPNLSKISIDQRTSTRLYWLAVAAKTLAKRHLEIVSYFLVSNCLPFCCYFYLTRHEVVGFWLIASFTDVISGVRIHSLSSNQNPDPFFASKDNGQVFAKVTRDTTIVLIFLVEVRDF